MHLIAIPTDIIHVRFPFAIKFYNSFRFLKLNKICANHSIH